MISYNLESLTVGPTEDQTVSRMTIGLTSDDRTFEQIKKQLNRRVEVIHVLDFTNTAIYIRELMLIKIGKCVETDMNWCSFWKTFFRDAWKSSEAAVWQSRQQKAETAYPEIDIQLNNMIFSDQQIKKGRDEKYESNN